MILSQRGGEVAFIDTDPTVLHIEVDGSYRDPTLLREVRRKLDKAILTMDISSGREPCPACGSRTGQRTEHVMGVLQVICSCGMRGPMAGTLKRAGEQWNEHAKALTTQKEGRA